jgi:hypothetical protein
VHGVTLTHVERGPHRRDVLLVVDADEGASDVAVSGSSHDTHSGRVARQRAARVASIHSVSKCGVTMKRRLLRVCPHMRRHDVNSR